MVGFNLAGAAAAEPEGPAAEGWNLESKNSSVLLYSRLRPSSSFKEFKAVTDFDANTRVVHNVLDDVGSYPAVMPYTIECRLLRREGPSSVLTYQRLSPKICSDRDYTLRIRQTSRPVPDGLVFLDKWELANQLGPAEKPNVVRVKISEGSWLLEPLSNDKTHATYSIYTDSGGTLPAFLANTASTIGIRKIFTAVRKQVKLPKYSAN
jgi:hypothetical protein